MAKNGISRRDFIKGAAAGAASAAALGVLGSSSVFAAETADDAANVTRYTRGYDNEYAIGMISDEVSSEEDADIVVIGSGIAGCMAANIAKEQGPDLKVILLEKNSVYGGSTLLAECNAPAVNADEESARSTAASHVASTNYIADPMLMYHMKKEAGYNASWLFGKHEVGYYQAGVTFYEGGNGTICINEHMIPLAEELGVDLRPENRAKALLMSDEYTCTGVQVYDANDNIYNINAKAVILCTGGMSTNKALLSYYSSQDMEKTIGWGLGQDGDGHLMAEQSAHGRANHLTVSSLFNNVEGFSYDSPLGVCVTMQYSNLWVNQDAIRFMDESAGGTMGTSDSGKVIECQGKVFSIVDQTHLEKYAAGGAHRKYSGFADALVGTETPGIWDDLETYSDKENVFMGETLEELAAAIGVDEATFLETISNYNGYCASGVDEEWGKAADYLWPIEEGPYYAFMVSSGMLNTNGGIRINTNAQVVDARYNVVEGLYAAGVCCSGFDGEVYGGGTCQTVGMWAGSKSARHALTNIFGIEVAEDWYGELMEVESGGPGGGEPEGDEGMAEGEDEMAASSVDETTFEETMEEMETTMESSP